jgi:hsp33 protein
MSDYIIKATAGNGSVRAFACVSTQTCEEARKSHNTSPVVSAALGRMLSAGLMMGSMMKNDKDLISIKIEGSGPMKGVLVTADNKGGVKGYPFEPLVIIPPNSKGKLDVAEAIGVGILTVIADTGLKEPYVGQVELISGEIAEDIAYYYASSEQVPSAVALGVLMNKDNTVKAAGGFIIQLMPGADEEIIEKIEEKIASIAPVTTLISEGKSPEDILELILADLDLEINEKIDAGFRCNCSRKRIEKALISIGKHELETMAKDNEPIEVGCHFCNKKYNFNVNDIEQILDELSAK